MDAQSANMLLHVGGMNLIKMTVHRTADSRRTDGGRFYYKITSVFMWVRKPGKRDISTHKFYLASWPEVRKMVP
jgi:hypothetical protein